MRLLFPSSKRYLSTTLATVHKGTAFEERSRAILRTHLSMDLHRVGGKSDKGIDLRGWWWIPVLDVSKAQLTQTPQLEAANDLKSDYLYNRPRQRVRVLAQCKAEKKKFGPKYIREMMGTAYNHMLSTELSGGTSPDAPFDSENGIVSGKNPSPLVALLISESPFTEESIQAVQSCPIPFLLFYIPPVSVLADAAQSLEQTEREHPIASIYPNPSLTSRTGPFKGQVEVRWQYPLQTSEGAERGWASGWPTLWFNDEQVPSWVPPN